MSEHESECTFKFKLSQRVFIDISDQAGSVSARSDSLEANNCYQVSFLNAAGNPTRRWFFENELRPA